MSGGHFDYYQWRINDIVNSIEEYLYGYSLDEENIEYYIKNHWLDEEEKEYIKKNKHTIPNRCGFSKEAIKEFKRGLSILRKAYVYTQRIDWLLSSDDGEESFHSRLKEELDKLKKKVAENYIIYLYTRDYEIN